MVTKLGLSTLAHSWLFYQGLYSLLCIFFFRYAYGSGCSSGLYFDISSPAHVSPEDKGTVAISLFKTITLILYGDEFYDAELR